jgi:hypothetical protein
MTDRRVIISEVALSTSETILLGAGIAIVVTSDLDSWDVFIAKACFVLAFLLLCVQTVLFLARRRGLVMYLIVFFACGAFGVIGLGAINYVNHKRDRKVSQESRRKQDSEAKAIADAVIAPPASPAPSSSPSPYKAKAAGKREQAAEDRRRRDQLLRDLHNPD